MYSIPEKLTKSVLNLIHQMTNIPNIPLKLCNLLIEYLKKTPIDLLDENLEEEEEDLLMIIYRRRITNNEIQTMNYKLSVWKRKLYLSQAPLPV